MEHIWSVLAAAGAWAIGRIPGLVRSLAAEGVAYAQKYYGDGHLSDQELEEVAVDYARKHVPWLPDAVVRVAIREVCRRRKAARQKAEALK
jgi:hypothetical protein